MTTMLTAMGIEDQTSIRQGFAGAWGRLRSDPLLIGLAGAVVLLAATTVVFISLNAVNYSAATSAQTEREKLAVQVEDLTRTKEQLNGKVSQYKPAFDKANQLKTQESDLSAREAAVSTRETDAAAKEADVASREQAVQAREDAATANRNAGDWWVNGVRECLARPGSYRMASATEGSLGRDVSCMSG